MSEKTATQVLRGRPVTHDEAAASADRLINSRFGKSNGARASIPARPDDDDIVITDYILEQRSASDPIHSVPAAPPEAPKATERDDTPVEAIRSAARFVHELAKRSRHTEAVADCPHCNLSFLAIWAENLLNERRQ